MAVRVLSKARAFALAKRTLVGGPTGESQFAFPVWLAITPFTFIYVSVVKKRFDLAMDKFIALPESIMNIPSTAA